MPVDAPGCMTCHQEGGLRHGAILETTMHQPADGQEPRRPALLPLPDAAAILNIAPRTLRSIAARGEIRVIHPSPGRVAFDPRDLEAYIAQQRR